MVSGTGGPANVTAAMLWVGLCMGPHEDHRTHDKQRRWCLKVAKVVTERSV